MPSIPKSIRQQVINEAGYRCEYCCTSSRLIGMPLVMDHILPTSLGGSDERENLCASCYRCNEFKGAKITTNDPVTNESVFLFNPRQQRWLDHFEWANGGTHIIGITASGRATVLALRLNNEDIVQASTARRKSKVKSQKSKVLWNGLFRDLKWLLYLRRGVLEQFGLV